MFFFSTDNQKDCKQLPRMDNSIKIPSLGLVPLVYTQAKCLARVFTITLLTVGATSSLEMTACDCTRI